MMTDDTPETRVKLLAEAQRLVDRNERIARGLCLFGSMAAFAGIIADYTHKWQIASWIIAAIGTAVFLAGWGLHKSAVIRAAKKAMRDLG